MTIERQIEAIHTAEIELYKPIASSVISTRTLHINCYSAAYSELKEIQKHGFSIVIYGAGSDGVDGRGIILSMLDMQDSCKEIGAGLAEETEEPGKSDYREAWNELGNDYMEVMEELGRDIKEME